MTFDPRAEYLAILDLVSIDTPDGVFRFIAGTDGIFTDINGHQWIGSRLINGGDMKASIQGEAPSGSLTLAFIQDPSGADLIAQIRELGTDYVRGREIVFWDAPIPSQSALYDGSVTPQRTFTRTAGHIEFDLSGPMERRITLTFEGPFTGRNTAPGWQMTTNDHSALIGSVNTSLRLMPTASYKPRPMFG
ncbi:hypothetical protein [Rhodobacter capsulatus]|jgi:hypothetical protein|nr:hypothetical protein [Rhodobacter capsulatus]ETD02723.1 hypothetical protein U714_04170 [Rhodobacter capsulatus DE442]ETD78880.1 hypothetical protein U717_04175 [Rhodobacter capsulatus R121]ETE54859.1 hypothetical protein U715_04165 [Rhodobacter capsulatus Y262]MDS0926105.1 hypothetical protein [Rhodobacter capsulatus]